jgi:hypothetical protein
VLTTEVPEGPEGPRHETARRRLKLVADRLLLFATVCTVAWALTAVGFIERWSMMKRAQVAVQLAGGPSIAFAHADGTRMQPSADRFGAPAADTRTTQSAVTVIASIALLNEGPRPVTIRSAQLAGPFLTGDTDLVADSEGRILAGHSGHVRGSITVDCADAAQIVYDAAHGVAASGQSPTELVLTVVTANGVAHRVVLTIDDTSYAVQGRACT